MNQVLESVSELATRILNIPDLKQEFGSKLSSELEEKFSKAKDKIEKIISDFNSIPGCKAVIYWSDSDNDALFYIDVPANPTFLHNPEETERNQETLTVGIGYARVLSSNTDKWSDTFQEWVKENFDNKMEHNVEMTIPKLYQAVQKLSQSYLKVLD